MIGKEDLAKKTWLTHLTAPNPEFETISTGPSSRRRMECGEAVFDEEIK